MDSNSSCSADPGAYPGGARSRAAGVLGPLLAAVLLAGAGPVSAGVPGVQGAQEPRAEQPPADPTGRRPKVGLVLSGGGARGAAHVGVLQQLEELRVPVDLVVGTSMGAIIGGLYAVGYGPDEIARVLEEADWEELFRDTAPREELWFRRRQDNRLYQVDVELGWRDGLALPPGLVLGRSIESFLERLTLSAATVQDFDRLRLPFRCVATDLADGSPVVLGGGSLTRAIRASMSLPGVFAPVEHEGRLLVDGGVVDNIPVDVARSLGAEVVIVVDISSPLQDLQGSSNPLAVSNQVVGILMSTNRARSLELLGEADVLLTPELGEVGTLSFDLVGEAVRAGRTEARRAGEALSALGVSPEAWDRQLVRQRRPRSEVRRVRSLAFESDSPLSDSVLRAFSELREGEPLEAGDLQRTRERLVGLGHFQNVDVDLLEVPGHPDQVDVRVRAEDKEWGPHYLRFGLGVSSDLQGQGEFDVGFQHTARPLNARGGEWRNEVLVGTRTRLATEFYQPLDTGLRWFVSPYVSYEQQDEVIRSGGASVAEVDIEGYALGLALGRNLGSWGELRLAYEKGWATARPEVVVPGLLPSQVDYESDQVSATLTADTLDSISFPREGLLGVLEARHTSASIGDDRETVVVEAALGAPWTHERITVLTSLAGGVTLEGEEALGGEFSLGGFRQLSGLGPRELTGDHYALAVLQPYYQLRPRSGLFGAARYLGVSLEYGGVWDELHELESDDLQLGASVYLGFDTLLGPMFVGFGTTEGGERSAYVFIGPIF